MLNFGASKPRVRGGARAPGAPPLDPHLFFQQYSRIFSFPNFCPKTTKSRNPKGSRLIFSIMIEYLYQWQIQHFRWDGGANLYISGKVFTKNFMTMKQKLVLRGERLCLEPPKIRQCLLPKLSYRIYVLQLFLSSIMSTFFLPWKLMLIM